MGLPAPNNKEFWENVDQYCRQLKSMYQVLQEKVNKISDEEHKQRQEYQRITAVYH